MILTRTSNQLSHLVGILDWTFDILKASFTNGTPRRSFVWIPRYEFPSIGNLLKADRTFSNFISRCIFVWEKFRWLVESTKAPCEDWYLSNYIPTDIWNWDIIKLSVFLENFGNLLKFIKFEFRFGSQMSNRISCQFINKRYRNTGNRFYNPRGCVHASANAIGENRSRNWLDILMLKQASCALETYRHVRQAFPWLNDQDSKATSLLIREYVAMCAWVCGHLNVDHLLFHFVRPNIYTPKFVPRPHRFALIIMRLTVIVLVVYSQISSTRCLINIYSSFSLFLRYFQIKIYQNK